MSELLDCSAASQLISVVCERDEALLSGIGRDETLQYYLPARTVRLPQGKRQVDRRSLAGKMRRSEIPAPAAPHTRECKPVRQRRRRLVLPENRNGQKPEAVAAARLDLDLAKRISAGSVADIGQLRRSGRDRDCWSFKPNQRALTIYCGSASSRSTFAHPRQALASRREGRS